MKKQMFILAAIALFSLAFSSCEKEETPVADENVTTSEDLATMQNLMQDTEDELELQIEERDNTNDCPTVTVETTNGGFPKTYTIDYGNGCEGPHGRVRQGQIIVTQTDTMRNAGAVRTATLVDFYVDGAHLQGTKTWANLGLNEDGKPAVSRTIEGASVTYPNGQMATWKAEHVLTQISGESTLTILDNTLEVSGSSSGVNRNGVSYSATIIEPLIKSKACPWIQQGVREVTYNNKTRTTDYGDGICDRFANVTLPNGITVTIVLHSWWQ